MRSQGITLALFAVFFQLWTTVVGQESQFRIVAGRNVAASEFPYQVEIERMTVHWCGGSIISKNFVLTAAHCVKAYEESSPVPLELLRLRVGNEVSTTGGVVHQIYQIITHERYVDQTKNDLHDIALVKVRKPFQFTANVKMVKLVSQKPRKGALGWVSGFGKQEMMRRASKRLRHLMAVELPVIELGDCRRILPRAEEDKICAGHKSGHRDSCTGDSGGPFVVNNQLAGIVAWGVGCGREGMPGVYTNVAYYRKWIDSNMRG